MKKLLLFIMALTLWSCKSDKKGYFDKEDTVVKEFAIPTDWQLDNLKGKVKTQICFIKDVSMTVPIKRIINYDDRGYRISEESQLKEENTEKYYRFTVINYTSYKNNFRSEETYGDGKSRFNTTELQWFSFNTYSAVIIYETNTDLIDRIEATNDDKGRKLSIEKNSMYHKSKKVRMKSREEFVYDDKGYLVEYISKLNDEDAIVCKIENKEYDEYGNVSSLVMYDNQGEMVYEIQFTYEYY